MFLIVIFSLVILFAEWNHLSWKIHVFLFFMSTEKNRKHSIRENKSTRNASKSSFAKINPRENLST